MTTPPAWEQTLQNARQLHRNGQLGQAGALYRQALSIRPDHADTLHRLGYLYHQVGRHDLALPMIERAIALATGVPEYLNSLSVVLLANGLAQQAAEAARKSLVLRPAYPEALNNLGNALAKLMGQSEPAVAAFQQAIRLRPEYANAHMNLGNALHEAGRFEEAITSFQRALALQPNLPEVRSSLGSALKAAGRVEEAMAAYAQALVLEPGNAELHYNLAKLLHDRGEWERAISGYRRAIGLRPQLAEAHLNLGLALLSRGEFAQGWREYEWRWQSKELAGKRQEFKVPRWDGSDLAGRVILLHGEQGLGDTIQFSRYARVLAEKGGRVVLGCQLELQRLLEQVKGVEQVVAGGQPLPHFDLQCPMLSAPMLCGTTLQTIPAQIPPLAADPQLSEFWRKRIASEFSGSQPKLRVGLAWAGKALHRNDKNRSLPFEILPPLLALENVQWISLQKGAAAEQTRRAGVALTDWTKELNDFADTAGLVANLDLVISVDTSVAHLAGAMGKPVWVLLPFVPDFRWLLDRPDSPWYPSARLFRQKKAGDWNEVVGRVFHALRAGAGVIGSSQINPERA